MDADNIGSLADGEKVRGGQEPAAVGVMEGTTWANLGFVKRQREETPDGVKRYLIS